jgi:meiosis-specific transcription factor NDT80
MNSTSIILHLLFCLAVLCCVVLEAHSRCCRQSPTSVMAPRNRSSSGSTKSVSPSLGSSVRSEYTTTTPGLARHLPSRPPQQEILASPHSPLTPATAVSPTMGSLASPSHDHGSNGLNTAGPPLGETQYVHHLSSADGHTVRPEIHARVDKGFFLSDRDWTCYRRNYFSVICSYSLLPATYSLPLYLRRTPSSAPEHILSFAMCISAVVDAPGGKTVELVQHTPKRDKGPQHKPAKIKLSPQPAGGMYAGANSSPVIQQQQQQPQQGHPSQQGPLDHEYSFPQQTQPQQQQQHIAVFDRIQFKSATANNGKRRAAQQYYHLIVELYADVGSAASSAPGQPNAPGSDGGWVKIAQRVSAPMVVRGRSPGHYADERRASSTSSPGGGSTGGNQQGGPHPSSHNSGGSGYIGTEGLSSATSGGSSQGMNTLQHVASPPTSSVNQHPASSIASGSPASHYTPIDPNLGVNEEAGPPIQGNYGDYTYVPSPLYESAHLPPPPSVDSGYETASYNGDRKSEHPMDTACTQYENAISEYIPTTASSTDSYRKPVIKEEFSLAGGPWLGSGAVGGRDQRLGHHNLYAKCGRFETAETSKGYFPDIPSL